MALDQTQTFAGLGLLPSLCEACQALRLQRPTPIQQACIPAVLNERYRVVIGAAETGSGKTAAFVLPILQLLVRDPCGPFAVILTPTRELAAQIAEQTLALGSRVGVRVETVVGGLDAVHQTTVLERERPHILVATPGRLAAFIRQQQAADQTLLPRRRPEGSQRCRYFCRLRFLVLDEADRLLEEGFAADLATLLGALPVTRRTLLFSATMSRQMERIQQLVVAETEGSQVFAFDANRGLTDQGIYATVASLKHYYLLVPAAIRDVYAAYVLLHVVGSGEDAVLKMLRRRRRQREARTADEDNDDADNDHVGRDETNGSMEATALGAHIRFPNGETDGSESRSSPTIESSSASMVLAMVFTASCAQCAIFASILDRLGLPVGALHGRLSQPERIAALQGFKSGRHRILVCTDLAARGLDIPKVHLVLNFDVPRDVSVYVHRVGRTARAGRPGQALSMVTQYDIALVQAIEATCGIRLAAWDGPGEATSDNRVMRILAPVLKARRIARLELLERGTITQAELSDLGNPPKLARPRTASKIITKLSHTR
jgi:ATP-dependent RNA helicase DDX49/DBP8